MLRLGKKWTTLDELRPGAIFVTRSGVKAVKSEYRYGDGSTQWECILLSSGEFAHFPNKNEEEVRQIIIGPGHSRHSK